MDIQKIDQILNLVEKTSFILVKVEQDGERIIVRRTSPTPTTCVIVFSQWVGTFLTSLVRVGDLVEKGQTLGIIKVLDLPIEVEAEVGGKIISSIVENDQVVEYGQPLFKIETTDGKEGKK